MKKLDLLADIPISWRPRGLILDADGVLHRGKMTLPGSIELLEGLQSLGWPFRIVTNNSRELAAASAVYFRSLGLPVPDWAPITAAQAMAEHVLENAPDPDRPPRVFVLGEIMLEESMRAMGCMVVEDAPDFVCVGVDYRLTYDRLAQAARLARECGRLVSANLDATIPRETGEIPGVGPIAAAVAIASGIEPFIAGKPSPSMFELALASMKCDRGEVLVIGDRLDSDVLGASRAGIRSALVLTGSHNLEQARSAAVRPEIVFRDLVEIMEWLGI